MKKRVLSMALCLVMLASVLPMSAFSTESGEPAATDTTMATGDATVTPTDAGATDAPAKTDAPEKTDAPAAGDDDTSDPKGEAEPTDEPTTTPEETDTPEKTDAPELDEAVAAVQKLIDALPSAEDMTALVTAYLNGEELSEADSAALTEAYDKLDAAAEAYYALTDAQREQVDSARLEQLAALFNSEVAPLADNWIIKINDGSEITDPNALEDALKSAPDNSTIYFLDDCSLAESGHLLPGDSTKTALNVNLGGHKITGALWFPNPSWTITNGNIDAISVINWNADILGTVTLDGVTITTADLKNVSADPGKLIVKNNSTVTTLKLAGGGEAVIEANSNVTTATLTAGTKKETRGGVQASYPTTLTVNGGTVGSITVGEGDNSLVNITGGTVTDLTVNGGTVKISGGTVTNLTVNGGTVEITGGTVTDLTVNGGNVTVKGELPAATDTYNIETINAKGGTVTLDFTVPTYTIDNFATKYYIKNVKNLNVSGSSATVTVNYGKIYEATVNGGNLTFNKGFIELLKSQSGSVSINAAPRELGFANQYEFPVTTLTFSGGTLSIGADAHSAAIDAGKEIIYELYVAGGKPELTNGVFGRIHIIGDYSGKTLLDLLKDGHAITGILKVDYATEDNKTETVNAGAYYNTTPCYKCSLFYIGSHTCDFSDDNDTLTDGIQCVCGRTCQHETVRKDTGICKDCSTKFFLRGTGTECDESDNEINHYHNYTTLQEFLSNLKLMYTYSYDLYGDIDFTGVTPPTLLGGTPPFSTYGKKVFLYTRGNSIIGTVNVGNSTDELKLGFYGVSDLSQATFNLANGNDELDFRGWTGDASGNRVIGGITAPGIDNQTVSSRIDLPEGYMLAKEDGTVIPSDTALSAIPTGTLKIVACTHTDIDADGKCAGCGQCYVAKLTKTDGSIKYFPYSGDNSKRLEALFGNSSSEGNEPEVTGAFGEAKSNGGTLTLLADVNDNTETSGTWNVSSGTFTLDLNGRKLNLLLRMKGTANMTIKDSSASGSTSESIHRLYIGGDDSSQAHVCTVEGGTINFIHSTRGTLNIKNGTVTETLVTGGTANITGGTASKVTVSGGTVNVSNASDAVIPEITTFAYRSGTVKLEGGKYKNIGYDASYAGDEDSKNVVSFLGDGYAYYLGVSSTEPVNASTDAHKAGLSITDTSSDYYYVRSHSCTWSDSGYDRVCPDCGRTCKHPADKVAAETGICSVCEKQLVVKETDADDNLVQFYSVFPGTLADGHTYTLMDDVTQAVSIGFGDVTTHIGVNIDLNSHTFAGESPKLTVNAALTAKIIGTGDLSGVNIELGYSTVPNTHGSVDLTEWNKSGNRTLGKLSFASIEKTDADAATAYAKLNAGITVNEIDITYIANAPENETKPITGQNLLAPGCAFKQGEAYVNYDADLNGKTGLTVVECTHEDAKANLTGTVNCPYCGQHMSVKVTVNPGGGQINTYFTDIADALAYAKDKSGCTVTLLESCTATSDLTAEGNFTLELNGKQLNINNGSGNLNVTGDLTIISSRKESGANGKINGNVTVANSAAKLSVSNTSRNIAVPDAPENIEIFVPEINILTVNGGTVKLSGGKYGSVNVTDPGKTVGDLLANPTTDGFKVVKTPTSSSAPVTPTVTWEDKVSDKTRLNYPISTSTTETTTITIEKLPIQSLALTTDKAGNTTPYDGTITVTATAKDADGTEISGVFVWTEPGREGTYEADTGSNGTKLTFGGSKTILSPGDHTIICKVTHEGYSKTETIKITVTKQDLSGTTIPEPYNNPNLKYKPKTDNSVYAGEGEPQQLMNSDKPLDSFTESYYMYSLYGKTWSKKEDFTQSEAGTYNVRWRLYGGPNYKFGDKDYYESPDPITVTISPLEITEVRVENPSAEKFYDGNANLPTQGDGFKVVPVYQEFDSETQSNVPKTITLDGEAKSIVKIEYENKNAGTRNIVATPDSTSSLLKNFTFKLADGATSMPVTDANSNAVTGKINPATLTVTAESFEVYIGESVPSLANPVLETHYTVSGYIESEKTDVLASLSRRIALDYYDANGQVKTTPVTDKTGEYAIVPSLKANGTVAATVFALTNGDAQGDVLDNYKPSFINGKLTVRERPEYTISVSYGLNGTISGSSGTIASPGTVKVKHGETPSFTITPNPGYVVASVKVDGVNYGSISTFTFPPVEDNHSIEATFMRPWGNPQTGVDVD